MKAEAVDTALAKINPPAFEVENVQRVLGDVYDEARRSAHGCAEQTCTHPPKDYATITLATPSGSMVVEVLLCEFHLSTVDMFNFGNYMLLRRKS